MRIMTTATMALTLLVLAGCATTAESDQPEAQEPGVRAESVDHAAAAMPADDELPAGFSVSRRCPGEESCASSSDVDRVSVSATSDKRGDVDEADWWFGGWFTFEVEFHPDPASAQAAAGDARDKLAETTSGEFVIEAERTEGDGFRPGKEGSGDANDYEVEGWSGVEGAAEAVLTTPDGERSAARQEANIIVTNDRTVVTCNATRYADEGEDLTRQDCQDAIADYLDRLDRLDPAEVPRQTTVSRLAAAMPVEATLPEGAEVRVRCPGDEVCEDQTQDASVRLYLPLPDGVGSAGDAEHERFRVAGGEWSEMIWLRAWIKSDEQAAQSELEEQRGSYGELVGELDTAPVETETGYDYGIRGRGEVIEISGDGWSGLLKLYDAQLIHLDGRVTERHYNIRATAYSGDVLVGAEATFTVEGRDQDDAVGTVEEHFADFFARLTQVE